MIYKLFSCSSNIPREFITPVNSYSFVPACALMTRGLKPVHTREFAPETRSRNTLPGKYPNQYTTRQLNDETTRLGHGNYESEFAMSCG